MSTEDNNDGKDNSADDPFAGWAEALEEQKRTDDKPGDAEQGGPLSGGPGRPV
jgi:flagellar motor switch protein FliN/FliY